MRFSFRLRSLLFIVVLVAIMVRLIAPELIGRLKLEEPPEWRVVTVTFVCRSPEDAQRAVGQFDDRRFVARANGALGSRCPGAADALDAAAFDARVSGNGFVVTYQYPRWYRSRFEIRRLGYNDDYGGSIALERNLAIREAFDEAGRQLVDENPLIVRAVYATGDPWIPQLIETAN